MNILKSISRCPLRAAATTINKTFVRERQKSPCSLGLESPHTKDVRIVVCQNINLLYICIPLGSQNRVTSPRVHTKRQVFPI